MSRIREAMPLLGGFICLMSAVYFFFEVLLCLPSLWTAIGLFVGLKIIPMGSETEKEQGLK